MDVLKESAPFKKKFLRANQAPYVTKELRIAIMKRSELKSKYLKVQTQKSFKGIIKRAELNKCDISLVSRKPWHKIITPSSKEWRL